jgi:DNA mismatch repair ATPase MutS
MNLTFKDKLFGSIKNVHSKVFQDSTISTQHALVNNLFLKDTVERGELVNKIEQCKILDCIESYEDKSLQMKDNVYNDIEFFERYNNIVDNVDKDAQNTTQNTVFNNIHKCDLQGGKIISSLVYKHPITDANVLSQRVATLKQMEDVYVKNTSTINEHMHLMKENERFAVWMFEEHEENLKELYEVVFFKGRGLQALNNSASALTTYNLYRILVSPLIGILAPIIYFVIPYLIIIYRFKVPVSFSFYIKTLVSSILTTDTMFGQSKLFSYIRIVSYLFSAAFYFQGIFSSIELSKTVNKISNLLITNLNNAIKYIKSAELVINLVWSDNISKYFKTCHLSPRSLEVTFHNSLEEAPYSIFQNFGKQLRTYKNIDVLALKSILQRSYMIDCLLGAIRYKKENSFSYVDYVFKSDVPQIQFTDMVHPCITRPKAVGNTIALGEGGDAQNAIITSPNSSGKSILIKAIMVNLIMAQTMGLCASSSAIITPFTFINTQINVPDSTGYESLFEAEMHRCKYNLDSLEKLDQKGFSLIIMDEIFNSTNPVEAISGAFAVCKRMSNYKTNMLIFTTHFNYLTKLAKEPTCSFANYRMETIVDDEDIKFTYKLEKGVNKHLLALELLRKSGFESNIITDAIKIKNKLTSRRRK